MKTAAYMIAEGVSIANKARGEDLKFTFSDIVDFTNEVVAASNEIAATDLKDT